MSLSGWLRKKVWPHVKSTHRRRAPAVETLEDRCVPTGVELVSKADQAIPPTHFSESGSYALRRGELRAQSITARSIITADGQFTVFESDSADYVPAGVDTNGVKDVFLYDNSTQTVTLVSHFPGGMAGDKLSHDAVISPDGIFVAFTSLAQLHPDDLDDLEDVYVWNRTTGQTVLASKDDGEFEGDGASGAPSIGSKTVTDPITGQPMTVGRVAFTTDVLGSSYVYVYDTSTAATRRLTGANRVALEGVSPIVSGSGNVVAYAGVSIDELALAPDGFSYSYRLYAENLDNGQAYHVTEPLVFPSDITPDGRFVVFASAGVARDEIYRVELATGAMTFVSAGITENAVAPSISDDGSAVAFATLSLPAVFPYYIYKVYVRDLSTSTTLPVYAEQPFAPDFVFPSTPGGSTVIFAAKPRVFAPSISGGGQFVAFETFNNGIDPRDTNDTEDVYVWNRADGSTALVSVTQYGTVDAQQRPSYHPVISGNGNAVAFLSQAPDLAPGVSEDFFSSSVDVFVRDLTNHVTHSASASPITDPSDSPYLGQSNYGQFSGDSLNADQVSADGKRVVYISRGNNLDRTQLDHDTLADVYIRFLDQPDYHSTLVSHSYTGLPNSVHAKPGLGNASYATISADGTFVAFVTTAVLDPRDNFAITPFTGDRVNEDIYLYDVAQDTTRLVTNPAGVKGNDASFAPVLSSDGRYMAFVSEAANLHPLDPTLIPGSGPITGRDVFFWDRDTGAIELVSVDSLGTSKGNGESYAPSISADGQFVTFESNSTNLDGRDGNSEPDVYVWDRLTGRTTLASAGLSGFSSSQPRINREGTHVVFESHQPFPGSTQVYLSRLQGAATTPVLLSATPTGQEGNGNSFDARIGTDGQKIVVAFTSFAIDLDPSMDTDPHGDIYVWEAGMPGVRLVSVSTAGTGGDDESQSPALSAHGRFVVFSSLASNLDARGLDAAGDGVLDIYLADLQNPQAGAELMSVTETPGPPPPPPPTGKGNDNSYFPQVSADGEVVVFPSEAFNLIANDRNGFTDVYANVRIPFAVLNADSDGDGVLDDEEDRADNKNGNHDNTDDRLQDRVASLGNVVDPSVIVTITTDVSMTLPQNEGVFRVVTAKSAPVFVFGPQFPVGTFSFRLENVTRGATAAIRMLLPAVQADGLYLLAPEPIDPSDHWHQAIPGNIFGGLVRAGSDLLLIVVDGGYGDLDGMDDGKITLEIAPATGIAPGRITGQLFNGHQDTIGFYDEPLRLAGAQIYLDVNGINGFDGNDVVLTQTDGNGAYAYDQLLRISYRVGVLPPEGWQEIGTEVIGPSHFEHPGRGSQLLQLGPDAEQLNFALNVRDPGIVRGVVRHDSDHNGTADSTERPVEGVFVVLDLNQDGSTDGFVQTGANGAFEFGNLPEGRHAVYVSGDASWQPVGGNQAFSVTAGQPITVDLPMRSMASISGYVWHDRDRMGDIDLDEEPLERWVFLDTGLRERNLEVGEPASFSLGGNYRIDDLYPGTYRVVVERPADWIDTEPTTNYRDVVIGPGTHQNFGSTEAPVGRITGTLYYDVNHNRTQDTGEVGVAGLTVSRDGGITATTDMNGVYIFDRVRVGTHTVWVGPQPNGWAVNLLMAGLREYTIGGLPDHVIDGPEAVLAIDDVGNDGAYDIIVRQMILDQTSFSPIVGEIHFEVLRQDALINNPQQRGTFAGGSLGDDQSHGLGFFRPSARIAEHTSAMADLNGDGAIDSLRRQGTSGPPALVIQLQNSLGKPMGQPFIYPLATAPTDAIFHGVMVFDLNGDGILDAVGLAKHPLATDPTTVVDPLTAAIISSQRGFAVTVNEQQTTLLDSIGVVKSDLDGVPDEVEHSFGNGNGDGNGDGIADSIQGEVATLRSDDQHPFVTLALDDATLLLSPNAHFEDVTASASPPQGAPPLTASFPAGYFSFFIKGLMPGATAAVELTVHGVPTIDSYYKYEFGQWSLFAADDGADNRITVTFKDGQDGDRDAFENGEIHDPGGPASSPRPVGTIGNQTLPTHQDKLTLDLAVTDETGSPLSLHQTAGTLAFVLDQSFDLQYGGDLWENWGGLGERWLMGADGWYFIEPSGRFHRWDRNPTTASGPELGMLDPIFFQRPAMLYDAAAGDLAYVLDQALDLQNTGNLWEDWGGAGERWLLGQGGQWYFITPDGRLNSWDGSDSARGTFLAALDPICFEQIARLHDAPPDRFAVSLVAGKLTIDHAAGFVGTFHVALTAGNGAGNTREFIRVQVTGGLTLAAIADQVILADQDSLVLTPSVSDTAGAPLTYSARAGSLAFLLDQQLDLHYTGSFHEGYGASPARWLLGAGAAWYFILPDGRFYRWNQRSDQVTGTYLASLDPIFYQQPDLLYDARAEILEAPGIPYQVSFQNGELHMDVSDSYRGTFFVDATVSNGISFARQRFSVART